MCVSRMLRVCASPNTSTCLPSCGSSLVHCGSSPAVVMAVLAAIITVPLALHNAQRIAFVFAPGIFVILCVLFLVLAALRFVTGWSLLKLQPWGRTFALVMAFTALIHPPLGTALGVYTLFVLLPDAAGDEYRQMSQTNS